MMDGRTPDHGHPISSPCELIDTHVICGHKEKKTSK